MAERPMEHFTVDGVNIFEVTDAKARQDVSDLKDDLDNIRTVRTFASANLLNKDDPDVAIGAFINPSNGDLNSNSSYSTTGYIAVESGQNIYFTAGSITARSMRFVAAYDASKTLMPTSGRNQDTANPYLVPNGVAYIRISVYASHFSNNDAMVCVGMPTVYEPYFPPYTETKINNSVLDVSKIPHGYRYRFDLASGGTYNGTIETQAITGYVFVFHGEISGNFTGVKVAKGLGKVYGVTLKVDDTNLYVYAGTASSPTYTYPHGLTIKDYISIVYAQQSFRPDIIVSTNGGTFKKEGVATSCKEGNLSVVSESTALTDCTLSYMCHYYNRHNWLYGNSYFDCVDTSKWTRYLFDYNIMPLLNGYPGRGSSVAIEQVKQDIKYGGCPHRIVWCLGMNDPDSNGTINASWKGCVDWLMDNAECYGYELVLATIPNVATVNNSAKNAFVEQSGLRYIDFASAVGAHDDTTWFTGMLSNDGVHPTAEGARALCQQALADLPELYSDHA